MTIIMNSIKRLITYTIACLALAACSDDEKYVVEPAGDDSTITFSISIPDPEKVVSRAGEDTAFERELKDLSVMIYDADGTLLQKEIGVTDFTAPAGDNNKTRVTVILSDEAKGYQGSATTYIVANAGHLLTDDNTATTDLLKGVTTTATLPAAEGFLMSGKVESKLNSASLLTTPVTLIRTEAKITVVNKATTTFTHSATALYNSADEGHAVAGADGGLYCEATETAGDFVTKPIYTYPCKNSEGNTFIIVKGTYNGIEYYYRINFRKVTEGATENEYLDLQPNHWYEVQINSVTGAGYESAEEAASHPASNDIEVEIYDHVPEVFDMAFDGTHELGVTDIIAYTGTDSGTAELYVKYYSKNDADMATAPKPECDARWLTIAPTPEPVEGHDDSATPGKVVKYKLTFHTTDELGSLETLITTTWQGLKRETLVTWDRVFDGNAISTAKLTIHPTDGSGDKVINDYWTFLAGNGTETTAAGGAPKLFGIQPEKMGGKVRNEGFHFPVMYGKRGVTGVTKEERWSYEYEVVTHINTSDYDCKLEITGDDAIKNYVNCTEGNTGGSFSFTLTRAGNASTGNDGSNATNDYTYATGKLTLTLTPRNRTEAETRVAQRYVFDLYHTGFFHYDSGSPSAYIKEANDAGYYYYEVLPVDGATLRTRYLLDRNIGAKAAGMYIQTVSGGSHVTDKVWPFDEESAGGYYRVADKGTNYSDPTMVDGITPPGYRVPMQRMWDAIRNSANYVAHQSSVGSTSYFTSYYKTKVTDNGMSRDELIYFPKARFIDDGNNSGDANSGYYWSSTASAGTEKEEIGRWLKCLQLSGGVTSYINGNVEKYYMSVRCINDIPDDQAYNVTSFNVKGATHVFLYKGDVTDKEYTTSWPGHAIGNHSTADQFFNFVYESTVYKAEDLKVIFNYVDETGKITTVSENSIDGLIGAEGWEAKDLVGKDVVVNWKEKTITY